MEEGEQLMRGWRHSRLVTSDIGFILDFPSHALHKRAATSLISAAVEKKSVSQCQISQLLFPEV